MKWLARSLGVTRAELSNGVPTVPWDLSAWITLALVAATLLCISTPSLGLPLISFAPGQRVSFF